MKKRPCLLPIAYWLLAVAASGCGFIEEIKHPTSFPEVYSSSHQNVDEITEDDLLAEGENLRITDVGETKTSIVRLIQVSKDAEIEAHTHENHDEVVYQVKGSGIAVLSGNQHPIKPGTVLLIPRGTPHGFINDGAEDSVALSFFSPPLEVSNANTSTSKSKPSLPIVQNLYEAQKDVFPEGGVKKIELAKSQDASLQLVVVPEDAAIGFHYHKRNDEVMYVVKGSGIVMIDGTRYVAKPGSVMIVPRKSYHQFINTGGEAYVALSLFSPPFTGKGTKYIKERKAVGRERAPVSQPRGEPLRE